MATFTFNTAPIYIPVTGAGDYRNDIGSNSYILPLDFYIIAGWDNVNHIPTANSFQGLIFDNPSPGGVHSAASTGTWTVTINGGVTSMNGSGIMFGNFLSKAANTLTVAQDGQISGTEDGVFIGAATNVTNNGNISGLRAINIDGFFDGQINLGTPIDNTSDYMSTGTWIPDSNITSATKITIANKSTGQIIGTGGEAAGINSHSYANVVVTNDGLIAGGHTTNYAGYEGGAFDIFGTLTLTNSATGTIDGDIFTGGPGSSITNNGEIDGTTQSYINGTMTLDALTNSGHQQDPLVNAVVSNAGLDYFDSNHNQAWDKADVLLSKLPNVYTNNGDIYGQYNFGFNDGGTDLDDTDDYYFRVAFNLGQEFDQIKNNATGHIFGDIWTGMGDDSITNAGEIHGSIDMGWGKDTIVNTGNIWGLDNPQDGETAGTTGNTYHAGVWFDTGGGSFTNSGNVEGGVAAKESITVINNANAYINGGVGLGALASGVGSTLTNSGTIYGSTWTGDNDGAADTVTNNATGVIYGGVDVGGGNNVFKNLGKIYGGDGNVAVHGTAGNNSFTNSGAIYGDVHFQTGNDLTGNGGYNTISNTKLIDGSIFTANSGTVSGKLTETITNSGQISGDINTGDGDRTITNSGTVNGIFTGNGTNGTGADILNNLAAGTIKGGINLHGGNNVITNAGSISSDISTDDDSDKITNNASGHISGNIFAGNGKNSYTNLGFHSGSYFSGGGADTVDNEKDIDSIFTGGAALVTDGSGDFVTNGTKGHVRGSIIVGEYHDDGNGHIIADDHGTNVGQLKNSGVIDGNVHIAGSTSAILTNLGKIGGQIFLNATATTVDDTKGLALGDVFFQGDNNSFLGGATAERVHSSGVDNFTMGAGNDMAYLAGISIASSYDGGVGTDSLDLGGVGAAVKFDMSLTTNNLSLINTPSHISTAKGFEKAYGSGDADIFIGSTAADFIDGRGGADAVTGGGGADKLYAGATNPAGTGDGAIDTFIYKALGDSTTSAAGRDVIYQFEDDHDVFDFTAITDNAIHFLGENTGFTVLHPAGDAYTVISGQQTILMVDIDGNGKADMSIALDGNNHHLTDANFVIPTP